MSPLDFHLDLHLLIAFRAFICRITRNGSRELVLQYSTVCMYVCMYGHHIQQSMDQPGKVANPARGQLNRENEHFPVPVRA